MIFALAHLHHSLAHSAQLTKLPDGRSSCDAGAVVLEPSYINDFFCDCEDGADEKKTAVCSSGTFTCKNKGFLKYKLYSSMVADGVCDCCDGSDEVAGACEDTCAGEAVEFSRVQFSALQAYNNGTRKKDTMAADARRAQARLMQSAKRMDEIQGKLEARGNELKQEMMAAKSHDMHKMQQWRGIMRQQSDNSFLSDFMWSMQGMELGERGLWFALFDKCFSFEYAERRYGHNGAEEDWYVMEFCPFRMAMQHKKEEYEARGAEEVVGVEYLMYNMRRGMVDGGPTLLGVTNMTHVREAEKGYPARVAVQKARTIKPSRFRPKTAPVDDQVQFPSMHLVGGKQCFDGPKRSVEVKVACGQTNALVAARENGKCHYEFDFQTPLACSKQFLWEMETRFHQTITFLALDNPTLVSDIGAGGFIRKYEGLKHKDEL
jgi:hypothetical protein